MEYNKVDIYTRSEAVYPLTALLGSIIPDGFEIHDAADLDEFLENKEANWDYVDDSLMKLKDVKTHITLYLEKSSQGTEHMNALMGAVDDIKKNDIDGFYGSLETEINSVKEEDWANNWKKFYKPFNVGEKLIIKPTWEKVGNIGGRKILEIDPSSSFGTGQHYTTSMVMELLEQEVHIGDRVLDLGCGSGILSIAAMLLGAGSAAMTDILENSVKTASENMERNGFDKSVYRAFHGNIVNDAELRKRIGGGFDVITANIVADVIISMSGLFGGFLKKDGRLIVSGIIAERFEEVKEALVEKGFKVKTLMEREGWDSAVLTLS